ncbi:hypothetical protein O181_105034 [Austropuccinia psidii MF-1]|uniref:Uncharacterized protein n=1 Tax=Austropuccinia psidii MF-1 TaxID=1389203 RepID=A0A9Q3JNM2_9BASI|nr:hypothetical protein [Austropuccinia psidii MF-1]
MGDIISKTRIGKYCIRNPVESKIIPKSSREDRRPERHVLKCHKCGFTSNFGNTFKKKSKINGVKFIEEVQCTEEKEESDQESKISDKTPVEDYHIENITALFEVSEVHTNLPQSSEDCYKLINI